MMEWGHSSLKKMFMLDEMLQRNASKFAILLLEYKNYIGFCIPKVWRSILLELFGEHKPYF